MTQYLEVTVGLPGSGKTTYALKKMAQDKNLVRVNRDSLRLMEGVRFDPKYEDRVTAMQQGAVREALRKGYSVIVDDTHLKFARLETWRQFAACTAKAADSSQPVHFIVTSFLDKSVEQCIENDLKRDHSVGKDVIESMYYAYWREQGTPANVDTASWAAGLIYPRRAIMCDLDGTLCLLPPGMGYPAAFTRDYRGDVPNPAVSYLMGLPQWMPHGLTNIILLTGRDSDRREETEEWLAAHFPCYDQLIMRPAGDKRPDYIVKKELYLEHVQGKYEVMFVVDDRPSVCRMWRAECGLSVMQCQPNMEF